MRPRILAAIPAILALGLPALASDLHPVERTRTYAISGTTGIALYRSIGERGPEVGGSRTIAHTGFDLTWTRDYRPQADDACVLAVARPHLTVTTTLPKAPAGLPPAVAGSWQRFLAGIAAHERVHGRDIVAMVRGIEAFSTGLSAPDDPGCRKVRAALQAHLADVMAEHRRRTADFERAEMSDGGPVHRLILDLVNGP